MSELLCEDDGELLDEGQGDLDAILGGVSEAVYENTVSVAQLKVLRDRIWCVKSGIIWQAIREQAMAPWIWGGPCRC